MKVQITVDKMLWRKARVAALNFGETMGEFVERSINESLGGGLRAGGTDGDAQRGGSIPRSKTVKAVSITASESKNPAPSPTPPISAYVSAPVVYPDESVSARHKCAICHLSFPESEMTYHAKTLRWACNECVEKQG